MARRRMISAELLVDEHFNGLTLAAQNLFVRMLAISDDCGVVPANEYTLAALTNPPDEIRSRIMDVLQEIIVAGLGRILEHNGKPFFMFKPASFDAFQSYVIAKRTKSEFLRIPYDEFRRLAGVSENVLEVPGNSTVGEGDAIESTKQKAESTGRGEPDKPESVDDVIALFNVRGYNGGTRDAELFFEHYQSTGWIMGNGRPCRDWRALAAKWNINSKGRFHHANTGKTNGSSAVQRAGFRHSADAAQGIGDFAEQLRDSDQKRGQRS